MFEQNGSLTNCMKILPEFSNSFMHADRQTDRRVEGAILVLLRRYFLAGVLHCQRMRASLCYELQREHPWAGCW
jgi:hypothetical protein